MEIDNEYDFLANLLFDGRAIEAIGRDLPLNTDDYPIIEDLTPRALMRRTELENVEFSLEKRPKRFPGILDSEDILASEFHEFSERMSQCYLARSHVIKSYIRLLKGGKGILGKLASAEEAVAPLETSSRYRAFIDRSRGNALLAARKDAQAALRYERSDALEPNHLKTLNGLGKALLRAGEGERAAELLQRSLALDESQHRPRRFIAEHRVEARKLPAAQYAEPLSRVGADEPGMPGVVAADRVRVECEEYFSDSLGEKAGHRPDWALRLRRFPASLSGV